MDIRRVDLNLLVVFETIYRTRNLTEAGDALGLTQSAVSHALRRVRDTFRDPLFVRTQKGLEPTPFAEELAAHVGTGLSYLRGALEKIEFSPATSTRRFRIVITDGEYFLLPELSRYLEQVSPGVSLETFQVPVKGLREAMAEGEVDLAMGFIPSLDAGFHQQLLFTDSYVCIVRRGHQEIGASLTLDEYLNAAHVLIRSEGTGHGELIERALVDKHPGVRIALRINRFLAIPSIIARTNMIATLPKNLANYFQPDEVRLLQVPLDLPQFEVSQFWHDRYHNDTGNAWLRRSVADLFKQQSISNQIAKV